MEPAVGARRAKEASPLGSLEAQLSRYRHDMHVNIDKIRMMHHRDFHVDLQTRIEANFKQWKRQDCRAFVYFVVFKLENIDEIDAFSLMDGSDESDGCRKTEISRMHTAEEYYHALAEEFEKERQRPRDERQLIILFRDRLELPPEQLEALVKASFDKLAQDCPQSKVAMIFSILQQSRYTICSKGVHVEEVPFSANERLVFEALYQFVKHSYLPQPVFGPFWLSRTLDTLGEYSASAEENIRQWLATADIALLAAEPQIAALSDQLRESEAVARQTKRYRFGLRLLRKALKLLYPKSNRIDQKCLELLVREQELPESGFKHDIDLQSSLHSNVCAYTRQEKHLLLIGGDKELLELIKKYTEYEPSTCSGAQTRDERLFGANTAAGRAARGEGATHRRLFNAIFRFCIGGYFKFVKANFPSLLVDSAEIYERHINPDIRGELYIALSTPSTTATDEQHAAFFAALCSVPARCDAEYLFEQFQRLLPDADPPLFLYLLYVFQHLSLLQFNRPRLTVEKYVFKKCA